MHNDGAVIVRGLQDMEMDDLQFFVFSTLGLGGWILSAELDRKILCKYTYNPFFSPILLVLFLCIIHAPPDAGRRVVSIVTIRSGTRTLDTTNDVHSPSVEVLLILIQLASCVVKFLICGFTLLLA